jgi:hypothetical protein
MKKLVAIAVVFALVTGVVFAADGVNINAWGRGVFAPLIVKFPGETYDGKKWKAVQDTNFKNKPIDKAADAYVGTGSTWGSDRVRVDFRIVGNSEYVGFGLNAIAEADKGTGRLAGNDDAAYIWAKPFGSDVLRIKIGILVEDALRGKIGTANNTFDNYVLPGAKDEDHIFTRFRTQVDIDGGGDASLYLKNRSGFLLSSAPIDGLFIGLLVAGGNAGADGWPSWWSAGGLSAFDAYNFMQVGAGYVIPNIGHVRAQYVGGFAGTYTDEKLFDISKMNGEKPSAAKPGRIEAAFALTAVDGLLVDLGGKFWLPVDFDKKNKTAPAGQKNSKGIEIGLGATFRKEALSVGFRFDGAFGSYTRAWQKDDSTNGGTMDFRLNPAYDLEPCTVGLLFGLQTTTPGTDAKGKELKSTNLKGKSVAFLPVTQLGFGAYAQKGLGKGSIKAGLTFTTATIYDGHASQANNTPAGQVATPYFSIPIILEYAFF